MGMQSFKLIWRNGAYYVSEPNIDTCEVVRLADAQERERVLRELAKEMYAALILIRAYAIREMRQQDIDGLEALLEKARAALAQ